MRIANKKYADDYEIGEFSKASEKALSQESVRITPASVKKSSVKKPTEQNISNFPSIPNSSIAEGNIWLLLLSCTIIIIYFRLLVSGKRGVDKGKSLKTVMQTATVSTVPNSESLEKDMVAPEGKWQ